MVVDSNPKNFDKQYELIEACRRNSKKAQLQLYNNYYKAMYTVSLNMVKESSLAEDLMQEAFISAFSKLSSFQGQVSFGAWLKKIVLNKCLDYLKKKKVQFETIDEDQILAIPDTVESDYLINKQVDEVKNEIYNLPDGYRTILTLHLLEGFDHIEISQILGISASTSRSQYTRAKALLIKKLKKQ